VLKPHLSVYTRICHESGRRPQSLDTSNVEDLAQTYWHLPVNQKLDYLLRLLANRTDFPGAPFRLDAGFDYPAVGAIKQEECQYLFSALADLGYIDAAPSYRITVKGWEHLGVASGASSGRCFVAMAFDSSLDEAYDYGILPAVSADSRYQAIRMDRVPHNEKICDKILAEIRQAQFVIADVTLGKQGVYFEAGFAIGLGLPVIWTCREDRQQDMHFDTRQYNHILWTSPQDLREQLRDRILATIGKRVPE